LPVCFGVCIGLFFKEVIKVSGIIKAKAVSDFGNIPICMPQQGFGFGNNAFAYMRRGGFAGNFFYCPV